MTNELKNKEIIAKLSTLIEDISKINANEPIEVEKVEIVPVEKVELAANTSGETETTNDGEKTLAELIPTDTDGYFTINVSVIEGKLVYGGICANTYKELELSKQENEVKIKDFETKLSSQKADYEAKLNVQKTEFEAKIVELGKISGVNPVKQAPVVEDEQPTVKLSKKESIKRYLLNQ